MIIFLFHLLQHLFHLLQQQLESVDINSPAMAHLLCRIIPSHCPFERKIQLFNRTIIAIPALCKLNPFYNQLVALRFKSLVYLADQCSEDLIC